MSETIKVVWKLEDEESTQDVEGRSIWLLVGSEKVRFFIHGLILIHYATGRRIAVLNPASGLEFNELLAQSMLEDVIEMHCESAKAFLSYASEFPILNVEGKGQEGVSQ